jgi:hypothetical protein
MTLTGIFAALTILLGGTPCDEQFLAALRSHDIAYISPEWAIWDAHEVCVNVEAGMAPEQMAQVVMQESNLDGFHAGYFVGASISFYCPRGG